MKAPTATDAWPTARDVVRELDLCQSHVNRLLHSGELRGVRTHWGYWLVDPASVAALKVSRAARQGRQARRAPTKAGVAV